MARNANLQLRKPDLCNHIQKCENLMRRYRLNLRLASGLAIMRWVRHFLAPVTERQSSVEEVLPNTRINRRRRNESVDQDATCGDGAGRASRASQCELHRRAIMASDGNKNFIGMH
jgi:hypothetical protein